MYLGIVVTTVVFFQSHETQPVDLRIIEHHRSSIKIPVYYDIA